MTKEVGRDPSGQALAVPVEPASCLAPSGFDPSRVALRKIAYLRPAGDVCGVRLKDAHRLIEQIERIALDALGEEL